MRVKKLSSRLVEQADLCAITYRDKPFNLLLHQLGNNLWLGIIDHLWVFFLVSLRFLFLFLFLNSCCFQFRQNQKERILIVEGVAGDLLLFAPSLVHRGVRVEVSPVCAFMAQVYFAVETYILILFIEDQNSGGRTVSAIFEP